MNIPLPKRPVDSHKGTFGRALLLAGSRGMSGAAALCGLGALRAGAGLVFLGIPEGIVNIVAAINPCYLTIPLPEDPQGRISAAELELIVSNAHASDAVGIGPGLGQSQNGRLIVEELINQVSAPLILDADALNVLSDDLELVLKREGPTIFTPHPGELARLTGMSMEDIQSNRQQVAMDFANQNNVILVLKGQGTVVTNGTRTYVNETGNPGMATGGSGDVLTGMMTAFLGQGMIPLEAAQLAVHLHGLAGDLAAEALGEHSMIASDLLDYLPKAFQKYHAETANQ